MEKFQEEILSSERLDDFLQRWY